MVPIVEPRFLQAVCREANPMIPDLLLLLLQKCKSLSTLKVNVLIVAFFYSLDCSLEWVYSKTQ